MDLLGGEGVLHAFPWRAPRGGRAPAVRAWSPRRSRRTARDSVSPAPGRPTIRVPALRRATSGCCFRSSRMSSIITRPKTRPTGRMYWAQWDFSALLSIMWAPEFGKRRTISFTSAALSAFSRASERERVQAGMGEGAAGVELVGELRQIEMLPPVGEERLGMPLAREGGEGVVLALEGRRRPAEAERGEVGGGRAVARGQARIERPGVLRGVARPGQEARGLLHGEAQGDAELGALRRNRWPAAAAAPKAPQMALG